MFQLLLPLPCYRCGELVYPSDEWDLDHKEEVDAGGRELDITNLTPSHKKCNRAHGATITNAKKSKKAKRERDWL